MAIVIFTDNLKRHIDCPPVTVDAYTVREALDKVFQNNQPLRGYILDDQSRLRHHMLIAVDGAVILDKIKLSDPVKANSEIYVMQALSGG